MQTALERLLNDKAIRPEDLIFDSLTMIEEVTEILISNAMSLEEVERLESIVKRSLSRLLTEDLSGNDARQLCLRLMRQGLWFKFKPYAIKASNPFGYSIFLQGQNQGFSFQNHLEHKTEVFHIVDVLPGGFVFLCHFSDWLEHYDADSFEKWLAGQPHQFFDSCKYSPRPGDTFIVSELGVVHTVIGCILEEFATISTDMVQRLHDQNDRNSVPTPPRSEIIDHLKRLKLPSQARIINLLDKSKCMEVKVHRKNETFGCSELLTDTFLRASHHWVHTGNVTPPDIDYQRVTVIRVFDGMCNVFLYSGNENEKHQRSVPIPASVGDVLVIPKKIFFQIENTGQDELAYSEHRIQQDIALI